jgi:hypothetical protein
MGLRAGPQGSGGAQSSLTPSRGGETAAAEHAISSYLVVMSFDRNFPVFSARYSRIAPDSKHV